MIKSRFGKTVWLASFAALAATFIGTFVYSGLNKAKAQPTANLPDIIVTTVTTATAIPIAPVNPSRRSFQICTATNPIWFAPVNPSGMTPVTPAANNGIQILANTCFVPGTLIANSGTSGGMGAAFNAISTGGNAIVSVLEY